MLNPGNNLQTRIAEMINANGERRRMLRFLKYTLGIDLNQDRVLLNLGGNKDNTEYQFRLRKSYAKTMLSVRPYDPSTTYGKFNSKLGRELLVAGWNIRYDFNGLQHLKPGETCFSKEQNWMGVWYQIDMQLADMSNQQIKNLLTDVYYLLIMSGCVQECVNAVQTRKSVKEPTVTRGSHKPACNISQASA